LSAGRLQASGFSDPTTRFEEIGGKGKGRREKGKL
jgi:hypothetical protein